MVTMGFFRKAGRQVEQFKKSVKESADETEPYRCEACDARFDGDRDTCPECGATDVTPTRTTD